MNLRPDSILTPEAENFLTEWLSPAPYVTAHTSGSTGAPKEIRLSKNDMRASARATVKFFGLNEGSVLALPLSPDYIAGKMQIVRACEAGCRLVAERPSSHPFTEYPYGECSLIPIVPSQLEGFMQSTVNHLTANVIIGGAPLSPEQERVIIENGISAYATYGMTETCSHVALRRIGEECYKALPGITFSTDSRGCLVIDSSTMSFGRLVTNDMVALEDETGFKWLGRYDNVINSGGIKIHPEEIERVLAPLLPHGTTAYVTARTSDRWGQEAVIVTDSATLDREILDRLKEILPPHTSPRDIVRITSIPLTSSGKIIRQKIND
ncbi:MAG: AMP-binding protein [Bacteroides sp.]|nr:AMP-binding protein [Bacteroides sp.]